MSCFLPSVQKAHPMSCKAVQSFSGGLAYSFIFLLNLNPPCLNRLFCEFRPLLWYQRCHACLSTLLSACLPALFPHRTHKVKDPESPSSSPVHPALGGAE